MAGQSPRELHFSCFCISSFALSNASMRQGDGEIGLIGSGLCNPEAVVLAQESIS